jgi:hypothetical protein
MDLIRDLLLIILGFLRVEEAEVLLGVDARLVRLLWLSIVNN